jgi:hypothetical protein
MRQSTVTHIHHSHLHSHVIDSTTKTHQQSHNTVSGLNGNILGTMSPPPSTSLVANNKRNYRVVVSSSPSNHNSNSNIAASSMTTSQHQGTSSSTILGTTSTNTKGTMNATNARWVTRELAALDFLLNIPLELEPKLVQDGWNKLQLQYIQQNHLDDNTSAKSDTESQTDRKIDDNIARGSSDVRILFPSPKGTWWEKWINKAGNNILQNLGREVGGTNINGVLEDPTRDDINNDRSLKPNVLASSMFYAPGGRRLDGEYAYHIRIPFDAYTTVLKSTMQKDIAKQAAVRQWEIQTAHGIIPSQPQRQLQKTKSKQEDQTQKSQPPLLDGRMFFSSNNSYPVSVFSMIRYEPSKCLWIAVSIGTHILFC